MHVQITLTRFIQLKSDFTSVPAAMTWRGECENFVSRMSGALSDCTTTITLLTDDLRRILNPNDAFATEASNSIPDGSDDDDGDDDGGSDGSDVDGGDGVEGKDDDE